MSTTEKNENPYITMSKKASDARLKSYFANLAREWQNNKNSESIKKGINPETGIPFANRWEQAKAIVNQYSTIQASKSLRKDKEKRLNFDVDSLSQEDWKLFLESEARQNGYESLEEQAKMVANINAVSRNLTPEQMSRVLAKSLNKKDMEKVIKNANLENPQLTTDKDIQTCIEQSAKLTIDRLYNISPRPKLNNKHQFTSVLADISDDTYRDVHLDVAVANCKKYNAEENKTMDEKKEELMNLFRTADDCHFAALEYNDPEALNAFNIKISKYDTSTISDKHLKAYVENSYIIQKCQESIDKAKQENDKIRNQPNSDYDTYATEENFKNREELITNYTKLKEYCDAEAAIAYGQIDTSKLTEKEYLQMLDVDAGNKGYDSFDERLQYALITAKTQKTAQFGTLIEDALRIRKSDAGYSNPDITTPLQRAQNIEKNTGKPIIDKDTLDKITSDTKKALLDNGRPKGNRCDRIVAQQMARLAANNEQTETTKPMYDRYESTALRESGKGHDGNSGHGGHGGIGG